MLQYVHFTNFCFVKDTLTPTLQPLYPPRKDQSHFLKFLTPEEVEQILNNVKIDTPAGFRNRVILELLWATGMRVSELSNLNFGDLNIEENEIRVFGKGAKERIVLMSDRAKGYLVQYIKSARQLLAPGYDIGDINDDSPLFINNTGYRLQNKTIRKVINEIVEKIELPKKLHLTFSVTVLQQSLLKTVLT